jgi:hypothetical protein
VSDKEVNQIILIYLTYKMSYIADIKNNIEGAFEIQDLEDHLSGEYWS